VEDEAEDVVEAGVWGGGGPGELQGEGITDLQRKVGVDCWCVSSVRTAS
jgi:hypothetical protein